MSSVTSGLCLAVDVTEEEYLRMYVTARQSGQKGATAILSTCSPVRVSCLCAGAKYDGNFVTCCTPAVVGTVDDKGLPKNWHFFLAFSFFRSASILQVRHCVVMSSDVSSGTLYRCGGSSHCGAYVLGPRPPRAACLRVCTPVH